jgi:glycosyltransferase involved in cell wall biosynthesis
MKVLVVSTADFSIGSGSEIRGRLICEGLRREGINVCVVCTSIPDYFETLGIGFYSTKQGFQPALEQASEHFKPDIMYGITEGLADLVAAAAQQYGCALAFDMHGIGVVEILELGSGYGSRPKRLWDSVRWLWSMRKADVITVANPILVPLAQKAYRNVVPVVGMTDITHFSPHGPSVQLGRDKNRTQVLYAGNYFKWQGIDLLFSAIEMLSHEQFEFTLLGSVGKSPQVLERWKHLLNSQTLHLIDSVDYMTVPQYYRGADIVVIPREFMWSNHLALPQKTVDYMASGSVIVATDLAPHRWALGNPDAGILCEPSATGLANGIRRACDKDLRRRVATNARNEAENKFNHLKQAQLIANVLASCVIDYH